MAPLHLLYCKCSFVIRLTAQNYSACQAVDNQLYTCKGISVCSMNKKRKSCAAVTAVCDCSRADGNHQLSTAGKSTADLKYVLMIKLKPLPQLPPSMQSDYNGRHIFSQHVFKGVPLLIQAWSGKSKGSAAPAFWPWGSSGDSHARGIGYSSSLIPPNPPGGTKCRRKGIS